MTHPGDHTLNVGLSFSGQWGPALSDDSSNSAHYIS